MGAQPIALIDPLFFGPLDLGYSELPAGTKHPKYLLGGVVFANATTASDKSSDVSLFKYWKPAAGIGLRVMIQKKSRANLNLDYGWGAEGAGAFYLNLNESF